MPACIISSLEFKHLPSMDLILTLSDQLKQGQPGEENN